jgi:hypothetical protein
VIRVEEASFGEREVKTRWLDIDGAEFGNLTGFNEYPKPVCYSSHMFIVRIVPPVKPVPARPRKLLIAWRASLGACLYAVY